MHMYSISYISPLLRLCLTWLPPLAVGSWQLAGRSIPLMIDDSTHSPSFQIAQIYRTSYGTSYTCNSNPLTALTTSGHPAHRRTAFIQEKMLLYAYPGCFMYNPGFLYTHSSRSDIEYPGYVPARILGTHTCTPNFKLHPIHILAASTLPATDTRQCTPPRCNPSRDCTQPTPT